MNKLKMQSKNLVDENIEKISSLFPNCVSEGLDESGKLIKVVDFDLLKQELSDIVVEGNEERYVLNWAGKKASMLAANAPIAKTLRPAFEESVGKDGETGKFDSENLYIEGDNLDVLKLLRETYLGKVKMIYIDPPYNTGNDFVYKDDFSMSAEEYFEKSNLIDDQGNRLFTNNDSNGRFHSDWLSMMYSRLKLAKDLLTDDGAIFISIDDNEIDNLKRICTEIFGEQNCLGLIARATGTTTGQDANVLGSSLDYCLCYTKTKNFVLGGMELSKEDKKRFNESDDNGLYATLQLRKTGNADRREDRPNMYFEVTAPNGEKVIPIGPTGYESRWRVSKASYEQLLKDNMIVWREVYREYASEKTWIPYVKYYLEGRTKSPSNLWVEIDGNKKGSIELKDLLGEKNLFSNPKPTQFIKLLTQLIAENKEGIILDFFSGSSTTADAIMQLNADDGGNRKHIMVQLPEKTDEKSEAFKAGYKTIPDIAKERIRRAGKKILEDNKNSKEPKDLSNLDIGFRVLKLDDSNMKDVYYSPSELKQESIFEIEENVKEDRTAEDLLFQVMLEMGVLLSSEIKTLDFDGKKVFNVNDGNLVCCFDKNISESVVTQIAKMKPLYAVFRDSSISSDSMSVNFDQIFETYSPTTTRKVL